MKVLYFPLSAVGHINPAINLCNRIRARGHEVVFVTDHIWTSKPKEAGYEVEAYYESELSRNSPSDSDPQYFWADQFCDSGRFSREGFYETLEEHFIFDQSLAEQLMYCDDQWSDIVNKHKPDLILTDYVIQNATLLGSKVPVVPIYWMTPLFLPIGQDKLPPCSSGYSTDDPTNWKKFWDVSIIYADVVRPSYTLKSGKFRSPEHSKNSMFSPFSCRKSIQSSIQLGSSSTNIKLTAALVRSK